MSTENDEQEDPYLSRQLGARSGTGNGRGMARNSANKSKQSASTRSQREDRRQHTPAPRQSFTKVRPQSVSEEVWSLANHFVTSGKQYYGGTIPVNLEAFSIALSERINERSDDNPLRMKKHNSDGESWTWGWKPRVVGFTLSETIRTMVDVYWGLLRTEITDVIERDRYRDQYIFLDSFPALYEVAMDVHKARWLKRGQKDGSIQPLSTTYPVEMVREGSAERLRAMEQHLADVDALPHEEIDFGEIEDDLSRRGREVAGYVLDILDHHKERPDAGE